MICLGHIYWVWHRVGSTIDADAFLFSFGHASLGQTCGLLDRLHFYPTSIHNLSSLMSILEDEYIFLVFSSEISSLYNDLSFILSLKDGVPKFWLCVS